MTLSTYVRVIDPIAARPVFDFCRDMLGCTDANPWEATTWGDGKALMNKIGQGLPSMLIVEYGPDGPLPASDDPHFGPPTQAALSVNFDTAYGYKTATGAGCADLHAWLVRELGAWLDRRGHKWMWQNEFTGEWFNGSDGLDAFGDADRGALRESAGI
jgi:hypothetical protein